MGRDNGGKRMKGFQEQLERTHGQNQGGWHQGREVGMAGVGGSDAGKMQTTVLEQQQKKKIIYNIFQTPFFNGLPKSESQYKTQ